MNLEDLQKIRKLQKLTIAVVSQKTGIHRDRVSLIERGKINPKFETVQKIATALNTQIILQYES